MKPILFNTEMVKAILGGRKTQTRRLRGLGVVNCVTALWKIENLEGNEYKLSYAKEIITVNCPYGKIGDQLWVRETFAEKDDYSIYYKANYKDVYMDVRWKPSIHMPKKYARIFLEITNINIERVQDITQKDALAEGMWNSLASTPALTLIDLFRGVWDPINKKRGFGWDENPLIWVIEFKRSES